MRQGQYVRFPETPKDLELVWNEAKTLGAHGVGMPSWFAGDCDPGVQRLVTEVDTNTLSAEAKETFFAEGRTLEALDECMFQLDENPQKPGIFRVYIEWP